MPLPLIPLAIIAIGVSAFGARKAHDAWADHPPLRGYCTHCGNNCKHQFEASGMSTSRSGSAAVAGGAALIGIASLTSRNIYKCSSCSRLTLACRTPRCKGMAKSGKYYDDEFCGKCRSANEDVTFRNALKSKEHEAAMRRLLLERQKMIDRFAEDLERLKRERNTDKARIAALIDALEAARAELINIRTKMAA